MTNEEMELTVDYLKNIQEGYIEEEGCDRYPLPEWYALDKAIELLEQSRWIPCSERMPEKNVEVLVTTKWDCITTGEIFDDYNNWLIYDGTTYADTDDIYAWMPLPEHYKEESEDV